MILQHINDIYIYINFKAMNNVLDAKMVLKTHLNKFRMIYLFNYFVSLD